MPDQTPEIPKMRKTIISTPGLGRAIGQGSSAPKRPAPKTALRPAPKKAAVREKPKANPKPAAKLDAKPVDTGAKKTTKPASPETHAETEQGARPPRKRELSPKEIKDASRKSSIKNKAAGGKRRSWGEPHPDLPFELYFRGQNRARVLFTGPSRTLDAFNAYCDAHNFTKWEALELLMRRLGPDPKITDEES